METRSGQVRHDIRFDGAGGEYFKIWIVNLALTIVTLGIYSAWAKVRNKRYFHGNTFLAGHNFEYHGQPIRILIGRLIALGLLLAYSISAAIAPITAIIWFIIFVVAAPWLIMSSLRFNARNTSYRNIRFDFHGTYGGAFKAFIAWPVLAIFTLFTTWPLAHRARYYYQINSQSFGGQQFETKMPGGAMYMIYLAGICIVIAGMFMVGVAFVLSGIDFTALGADFQPGPDGTPPEPTPAMVGLFMVIGAVYLVVLLFMQTFVGTMVLNLAVNGTRLGDSAMLQATLSPLMQCWILFSNLVLIVVTLGLFSPWAHVRQARYVAAHIAVIGPPDTNQYIGSYARADGAIGEEVAGFFDFDFSL
jgi:uncharacterized membrane protein YjgN (DUF898 family)